MHIVTFFLGLETISIERFDINANQLGLEALCIKKCVSEYVFVQFVAVDI